jgi:hypothetical protein
MLSLLRPYLLPVSLAFGAMAAPHQGLAEEVYSNDFNGPPGSQYPEWRSSSIAYESAADPPGKGVLPPQLVTNTESANGAQRFLGEFGGPKIGQPGDPGYNRTRVDQTISLTLHDLAPHGALRVSFDLYVLKSWDGNSPAYGPDSWSLGVEDGPILFTSSFSNNQKVRTEGSYQDYPIPGSLPHSGAVARNTLGCRFFGDSIYALEFVFAHSGRTLTVNFRSSLFEGKGTADESWGLDNVRVTTVCSPPRDSPQNTEPAASPGITRNSSAGKEGMRPAKKPPELTEPTAVGATPPPGTTPR